ncbi:hypothetical protein EJ08DRAFT_666340 [Tothia fuscella]|uniref:Uncharacterized protein n=1 Tax=Tothia fuscella TaxID=1048955 RepID=A0A9P4NEU2_9PEZI|nr:hypothetical protein EJ08DRAFT_666340 [Tothia fuscella]
MSSILKAFNALLPFTDPSTPLWRDIIHTVIICTVLYIAPSLHLERWFNASRWRAQGQGATVMVEMPAEGSEANADSNNNAQQPLTAGGVPNDQPMNEQLPFETEHPLPDQHVQPEPEPEAGAMNEQPQPQRRRDPNREVGAKKARSLARRDQQRAYNEFMREQGEAQRSEWARDAAEREKDTILAQQRRKAAEAKINERERKAREEKREREDRERRDEALAVKNAVAALVHALEEDGAVNVEEVARKAGRGREWAEGLIKREGVLGVREVEGRRVLTLLTGKGWVVRVDQDVMAEAYKRVGVWNGKDDGKVSFQKLGRTLQQTLRERPV